MSNLWFRGIPRSVFVVKYKLEVKFERCTIFGPLYFKLEKKLHSPFVESTEKF